MAFTNRTKKNKIAGTTTQWNITENKKPKWWVVVDTISTHGKQQRLCYCQQEWYRPDRSMSVFYVPKFWKPIV